MRHRIQPSKANMSTATTEQEKIATIESEKPSLQAQLTELANSVSAEAARIVVAKVFADLVFLLDYLSLVETNPQELGRALDRLSILHAVRGEANAMVEFIETHAMQNEGLDEFLRETLDGSAYAIKHEVRRIFEGELVDASNVPDEQKLYGTLIHAQGVLTNCFQQCVISLARVFDCNLTGAQLFHDWQIRRERSLKLCDDLSTLTSLVQAPDQPALENIASHLKTFREGSMQWLMYKDWQEYEALSNEVTDAISRGENPTDLLHRLGCYLETLLAHVKTRCVLAESDAQADPALEEVAIPW